MRTVQMTLDEDLVKTVDRAARRLHTTRSGFTRNALRAALSKTAAEQLEMRHRKGYEEHPVAHDEFSAWQTEQKWGSE
jgi:metal-responsive CopG/Arc/MetJ family transcriptional regulator